MQHEPLDPTLILHDLRTQQLPGAVRWYPQVESTMDLAREWLQTSSATTLLVGADEQTAGRGRQGRRWIAPAGSALLSSLALRPPWLHAANATVLVQFAAVALCEAVIAQGIPARLKWPNDLLVPTAPGASTLGKAAGILLEAQSDGAQRVAAIIGIGINVSAAPPAEQTRYPATHLSAASGRPISRLELMQTLLRRLDAWYVRLADGESAALFAAWRTHLHTLGQFVQIELAHGSVRGIAEDVAPNGTLLVRDEHGTLHQISSGDVGLIQ
jgi:BirA family biotin operon repressor/biotin-[acetyl-CoA-carboxylase] ligase